MSHNFAQIWLEIGRKSDDFRPEKKAPGLSGFWDQASDGPGLAKKGRAGRAYKARPIATIGLCLVEIIHVYLLSIWFTVGNR